jgi:hypothetical protein
MTSLKPIGKITRHKRAVIATGSALALFVVGTLGATIASRPAAANASGPEAFSIAPASATEGNSGTTPLTFTISSPTGPEADCKLNATVTNRTATWLKDYKVATPTIAGGLYQTLIIPAGATSTTFTVDVIGDTDVEGDQTFNVGLTWAYPNPCGVVGGLAYQIDKINALGTIIDDDVAAIPTAVSIAAPAPIQEGDSGTTPLDFVLSAAAAPAKPCQIWVIAENGAASYEADESAALWGLTPTSRFADWTLTEGGSGYPGIALYSKVITVSAATTTFTVDVIGDTLKEAPVKEKFSVRIVKPLLRTGSVDNPCDVDPDLTKRTAVGTIIDNDAQPAFSIAAPAPVQEGNAGITPLDFVITAASAPTRPCQLWVIAENGAASYAADESIALWGLTATTPLADWTLTDGGSGYPGIVLYSKVITISAQTTNFTVDVIGDLYREAPSSEKLSVRIVRPIPLAGSVDTPCEVDPELANRSAVGTILDDDSEPLFAISGPSAVTEGDSGTKQVAFTVQSPSSSAKPCQIQVTATNATALVAYDWNMDGVAPFYTKTITFDGTNSQEVLFNIVGDTINEGDETFNVTLTYALPNPCPLDLNKLVASATIIDDDVTPVFSLTGPATVVEGNSGVTTLKYKFSAPTTPNPKAPCQLQATALNGTALWLFDWKATGESQYYKTFTLDAAEGEFSIDVLGDTASEFDELYTVNIVGTGVNPCLVDPLKRIVSTTILNDDVKPVYALTGPDVIVEGNSGVTPLTYTIATSTATTPGTPCQVLFTALNVTAAWTLDWNLTGHTNYFKTVTIDGASTTSLVDILGDLLVEADETYTVSIVGIGANPCLVDPAKFIVTTTIKNDDAYNFSAGSPGVVITGGTGPATPTPAVIGTSTSGEAGATTTTAAPGTGSTTGSTNGSTTGSGAASASTGGSSTQGAGSSVSSSTSGAAAGSTATGAGSTGSGDGATTSTTVPKQANVAGVAILAETAAPATVSPIGEVASIAFTGAASTTMTLEALSLITLGLIVMLAQRLLLRRRR